MSLDDFNITPSNITLGGRADGNEIVTQIQALMDDLQSAFGAYTDFTPSTISASAGTWSPTMTFFKYQQLGKTIEYTFRTSSTDLTVANADSVSISLPVAPHDDDNGVLQHAMYYDGTDWHECKSEIIVSTDELLIERTGGAQFISGSQLQLRGFGRYETN